MAARYSRLPTEDVELGQSAFDYKSAFTYGQSFPSRENYKSIFKYKQAASSMSEDSLELTVGEDYAIHKFLCLTLSQTSLVFMSLQCKSFENSVGKEEISSFPTVFSTLSENFLPFSSKLEFLSAFSVWKSSIICYLGKS